MSDYVGEFLSKTENNNKNRFLSLYPGLLSQNLGSWIWESDFYKVWQRIVNEEPSLRSTGIDNLVYLIPI